MDYIPHIKEESHNSESYADAKHPFWPVSSKKPCKKQGYEVGKEMGNTTAVSSKDVASRNSSKASPSGHQESQRKTWWHKIPSLMIRAANLPV